MKSESQRQREATIFDAARQLTSPEERAAYLDLACKGDAALRQRIECAPALPANHRGFPHSFSHPHAWEGQWEWMGIQRTRPLA